MESKLKKGSAVQPLAAIAEQEKAFLDTLNHGTGVLRTNSDGSVEHIPYDDFVLPPVAAPVSQHIATAVDAANFIDKRAEKYLQDHADSENDTGAVVFHYGEAGRDYHSTLVELAEELRALAASEASAPVPRACGNAEKIVPAEPTIAMCEAALTEAKFQFGHGITIDSAVHIYRAMLKVAPDVAQPAAHGELLRALAFRTLWIAYVWNDHNFEKAHIEARETCKKLGIKNFEQANKWLESLAPQGAENNQEGEPA